MWTAWPFVGRDSELQRARAAVVDRPSGHGVLLHGLPGTGRSHLLRQLVTVCPPEQFAVVKIVTFEATPDAPLWLCAEHAGIWPAEPVALQLQPELGLAQMAAIAGGRRILLVVDDAHLLGPLTAAFVYYAVARGQVSLAATLRDDASSPVPIDALWREDLTARVAVRALGLPATHQLLRSVFGGPFEEASARRLWQQTRGIPKRLRDSLELLKAQDGAFVHDYGLWRWVGAEIPLPASAAQRISGFLRDLPAPTRQVIELVALAEPVSLAMLTDLTDPEAVEAAEYERLIEVREDGRRTYVHVADHLDADAVQRQTPVLTRRRHLRALTDQTRAFGARRQGDALRIGRWHLQGSGRGTADELTAAARTALTRFDLTTAAAMADCAVSLGAGFDAAEILATVRGFTGDAAAAVAILDAARPQLTDDDELTRWALARALIEFNGLSDTSAAQRLVDAADRIADPQADILRVLAACLFLGSGRYEVGRADLERLRTGSPFAAARIAAAAMLNAIDAFRGAGEAAAAEFPALEQSSQSHYARWPATRVTVEFARWTVGLVTGRTEWLGSADETESAARFFPSVDTQALLSRAIGLRLRGRFSAAWATAVEAQAHAHAGGRMFLCAAIAEVAHICALLGNDNQAREAMADCDRQFQQTMMLNYPIIELARIQVAALTDTEEAAQLSRRLARRLYEDGFFGFEVHALHQLARLGQVTAADAERLQTVSTTVPGPMPRVAALHAQAVLSTSPTDLASVDEQFTKLGLSMLAAEAAAQRFAVLRAQRSPGVGAAAQRLADLLDPAQAWTSTAMNIAVPTLTDRQWEVVDLAANGLSNAQISAKLQLGQRSSESHLHRLYDRLGADGRADLPGLARLYRLLESDTWSVLSRGRQR